MYMTWTVVGHREATHALLKKLQSHTLLRRSACNFRTALQGHHRQRHCDRAFRLLIGLRSPILRTRGGMWCTIFPERRACCAAGDAERRGPGRIQGVRQATTPPQAPGPRQSAGRNTCQAREEEKARTEPEVRGLTCVGGARKQDAGAHAAHLKQELERVDERSRE